MVADLFINISSNALQAEKREHTHVMSVFANAGTVFRGSKALRLVRRGIAVAASTQVAKSQRQGHTGSR